ncbi:hypothetical protein MJT46_000731 [Ovis ammon polii x Ovis aries]|nr:hypothetical protein MJT46_000731 [Ovis ammon polii x Ovis aries]
MDLLAILTQKTRKTTVGTQSNVLQIPAAIKTEERSQILIQKRPVALVISMATRSTLPAFQFHEPHSRRDPVLFAAGHSSGVPKWEVSRRVKGDCCSMLT